FSAGRLIVEFNAPAEEGNYSVELLLQKENGLETVYIAYDVKRSILSVSADGTVRIPEGGEGSLRAVVYNPGAGITTVKLYSSFPSGEVVRELPAHEAVELEIPLYSSFSGTFEEKVYVVDLRSGEVYESPVTVEVYPTLYGRIRSVYLFPELAFPLLYPIRLLLGVMFWKT
ncbi:MAG: hypothetical protein GXO00_03255, partial [Candidatus Diapherotrites archaeon]|nr:hypothetical protein [Candidatus Diapherotrites archaeon]